MVYSLNCGPLLVMRYTTATNIQGYQTGTLVWERVIGGILGVYIDFSPLAHLKKTFEEFFSTRRRKPTSIS